MNRFTLLLPLLLLTTTLSALAQDGDAILGKWINPTREGQIQIYKKGALYFGKLVWIKLANDESTGNAKLDKNNPDPLMKTHPLLGLEILKDFKFDGENSYQYGSIYDPKNGKTYKFKMTLNNDKLNIRGYIGVSLFGRSETWTKVK